MRSCRALAAAGGLALALLAPSARADQPTVWGGTGVMGGPGGLQFSLMCPPDSFLVGAVMLLGEMLDYYEPVCAYVQTDGTTGPHFEPFSGHGGAGGTGGGPGREDCPPGYVVTGAKVGITSGGYAPYCTGSLTGYEERSGVVVGRICHVCRRVSPPFDTTSAYAALECPPGQWATGVYGRSGTYVDSIGLVCGPAFGPYATAHLPPPPPPPARSNPEIETLPCAFCDTDEFTNPMINGYAVDVCLNWGSNCGQLAADEFCRRQGFARATAHTGQANAPPTYVIGDDVVCNESFCARFASITCTR